MTNAQLNYLRMVITRRGVLNIPSNQSLWNTNTKIVSANTSVETILAQILADAGIQEQDITGATTNKESVWDSAVKLAVHVCTCMRSYAEDAGNNTLYQMMHYKKSDLDDSHNDIQSSIDKMNLIYTQATQVLIANLTPFNISAANLTSLNSAIQALTAAAPQHRVLQVVKKTSTENIKKNFALLRKAGKKLNNLVHTLKLTQETFVLTFDNACKIINLGKAQMAEERHLHPSEHIEIFKQKFLVGDTFTIRNHSDLANIKVWLSDTPDVPATGGKEIAAHTEIKLEIPTAFEMPFGHSLIIENLSHMDDAHVTVVLAHGKSHSKAPEPILTNP
jgi:hypothetical protein